jgi:protein involved in polysaccharide export with SLBB domain
LAEPKNNYVPIDIGRLSQPPPRNYLLDAGDTLGIYIEGVLPFSPPDQPPEPPPVNFPDQDSQLPPSIGFPSQVQEDGTISLPLVRPINVRGMTVEQVREVIRNEYLRSQILQEEEGQVLTPIVSLIRERTYNVTVVREDISSSGAANAGAFNRQGYLRGSDRAAAGDIVQLPAYQNDVLHALMETGGLPGLNAKNEVKVLKASRYRPGERDVFIQNFYAQYYANPDPCGCPPPLPEDPNITRIPLRLPPGVIPSFRPEDVVLEDGDIVLIESRDAEVFYTGGLLAGGEWAIPRDYDLDILGAIAIAGGGIGGQQNRGAGGGVFSGLTGSISGVPPGRVYILRKTPCNGQLNIEVDMARAINNPRERILIQPGDTIILRYKPEEELLNFGVGTFFTFGIQELFRR